MRNSFQPVLLALLFVCGLMAGRSAADELEKGLQRDLSESRQTVVQAGMKIRSGRAPVEETALLKSRAEKIRAARLLMEERFTARAKRAALLGGKAAQRQETVAAELSKALEELLARIDAIPPDGTMSPATLDELNALLDRLATKKKRPLHGSLPYRHLAYPAREPATFPIVIPAYKGGDRTVTPADTAASPEAPVSAEITTLARSLQWNPVLIYEWVKNNVATEWYFGVMKGAEETLRQKSGNDADQAALLVSLLRASGFPARFVKGTIEFFPGIDKVKSLTGIDDPMKIAAFFQKAGIPFKPVISGGTIANFQVEHVWVESQIPYSNYRGAVMDDMGKSWLGLDTSIKPHGLAWNQPLEIPGFPLDTLRDDYLQAVRTETPLEFVKAKAEEQLAQNNPGKGWQDLLQTKTIIPDVLNIIPGSLQFRQIAITGEYTELPAELLQKVRFFATSAGSELFDLTLPAHSLASRKIALTYEPETVEDQTIIDSFGGLDNTPSYLVRLRPVLKLDEERLVVAQDGLPMGDDYTLAIETISPNGVERTGSTQIAGNLAVIGVVSRKAVLPPAIPLEEKDASRLLHEEALGYIDRWNRAEDELAALLKVAVNRPVPTVAIVGGVVEVTRLLDLPHSFEWQGVFVDALFRRVETVAKNGEAAREQHFMRLSSLQGSVLEHRIFEDDLQVDSISTAKLLQLAKTSNTPLLTIDRATIDTILPALPFDDNVKQDIADAVGQGLTVTIPQTELVYRDWKGIGYLKENPATGEAGWMLSGGIAGGMTAQRRERWYRQDIAAILAATYKTKTDLWSTGPLLVRSLGESGNIALMQTVGSLDASFADRPAIEATRRAVAREYFKTHGDVDFLVILATFNYALPETDAKGFYLEAKNDTKGIGRDLFDYSGLFGSQGRLQGTIDLGNITGSGTTPDDRLEGTISTLAHELGHRFGAYVKFKNNDGSLSTALLGKDNAHWSYLLGTNGSPLYGNGWKANPDGTFTSTAAQSVYSPLDLYLMGLLPKEEVPPLLLIGNPRIDRAKLPNLGDTITGTPRTIAIDDIVAAEGERIPTAADAPKTFTVGYVLLKRPGDDITPAAKRVELLRKGFAGRFRELTQNRGSIGGIAPEIGLQIESPSEGATITGPDVTVSGNVVNTTAAETGVTVNGIPATVIGSRFIVNHVPLQEGTNTIEAKATDANGLTATATRSITAQAGHYLRIYPNIDSGTGPLNISFRLDGSFTIANPSVSIAGPAAVSPSAGDTSAEYTVTLTDEGSYTITARAEGPDGRIYSDSIVITVISKAKLEALLKEKWEGMRGKIAVGDVEGIVGFIAGRQQGKYREFFTALDSHLSLLNDYFTNIELVYSTNSFAKARMLRDKAIEGQVHTIEYIVYFVKENGIWKAVQF